MSRSHHATSRGLRWCLALALLAAPLTARAGCPEPRPTDPISTGYSYEGASVMSFDGARVRVWYATEGKHAPELASTRADGVPDHVALASQIAEDALESYATLGFREPLADDEPGCDGGDGRLDLYLMAFAAADGHASPIQCAPQGNATRCSSFLIAERRPQDRGYASFEEGARTILPHELFHAVQNAYDAGMDGYWAEGTAQWAADRLAPSLGDLERFLPAFLEQPGRSLDLPPGGVTAAFLYGSALWPLFLDLRRGPGLLRGAFELQGQGQGAYAAISASLLAAGAPPEGEMMLFRAWNASTGARADGKGYPEAGAYPEVPYKDTLLEDRAVLSGVMAGLSAAYYPYRFQAKQRLVLEADEARIRGLALPVVGGRVLLEQERMLPTELEGEGVVVLAGVSEKKSDVAYTLRATAVPSPPVTTVPPTASAPSTPASTHTATTATPLEAEGGCSFYEARSSGVGGLWLFLVALRVARVRLRGVRLGTA